MYAAASVFRNFQKTQKLVSGGWCLGSKETDQPVAGRAACMIRLVYLEELVKLEETQNIVSGGLAVIYVTFMFTCTVFPLFVDKIAYG